VNAAQTINPTRVHGGTRGPIRCDSCGALYDPEIHSQFCPHILQAGVTGPSIAPDVPRATNDQRAD
jgi:hypothetical protein